MNYPNYDSKVVERYQTKLIGWTYHEFKSPFDIHVIDDVRILLEALQCGRCCWVRMTKSDLNLHRNEMNKRREAGETVGKPSRELDGFINRGLQSRVRVRVGRSQPWKNPHPWHGFDGFVTAFGHAVPPSVDNN